MAAEKTTQEFTPVKTYKIVNPSAWRSRYLELRHNDQVILWITNGRKSLFSSSPPFTLHSQSPEGPVVAAGKFPSISHGIQIQVGDPGSSPAPGWAELQSSFSSREYTFAGPDGRAYAWRRTHNKALGAATLRGGDFKLLDLSPGADPQRILAAYIEERELFGPAAPGRIDWLVEFAPDLELVLMTAMLMIEAQLRAKRRRNNAGGAGGGAGAGA